MMNRQLIALPRDSRKIALAVLNGLELTGIFLGIGIGFIIGNFFGIAWIFFTLWAQLH